MKVVASDQAGQEGWNRQDRRGTEWYRASWVPQAEGRA